MTIILPEKVKYIIDTIAAAGYEAYAVGGCIRDSILGRVPDDWDITTSARPEQVKELFRRTIDTGIAHGTVTVMLEKEGFEVTTYRIDGEYEDSRHPKEVTFTANLVEDLKRRDFTINAMAYNETAGLVDVFGGMEDIARKMIRCVGNAEERFTEDALRMMRAIRFSAQLGYEIEESTREAICRLASNLKAISAERIQTELVKLLMSPHPDYLRTAYETGVTGVILPEFDACMETPQDNKHHCYNVGEHTLHAMTYVPAVKIQRLTMLFHDIGKPVCATRDEKGSHFYEHDRVGAQMTAGILKRLRFDNDTLQKTVRLVECHDWGKTEEPNIRDVRRGVNAIGEDIFPDLYYVKRADILAQSTYDRERKLAYLEQERVLYQKIVEEGQCVSLKTLAVTGRDLIEKGMKPGKEIGEALHVLLEHVLDVPEDNQREILLKRIGLE